MADGSRTISGWDAPLDVDWDFQLAILRREIKLAAPSKGGALAHAFDSPDTAVMNESNDTITVSVGRQHKAWPYAAIQNFGGPRTNVRIPKRKGGKVLRFFWMGKWRFFSHVTMHAGQILGSDYVYHGVFNWWARLCRGAMQPGSKGVVQWRNKHYSEGLR